MEHKFRHIEMQSETADLTPIAGTWRTGGNRRLWFWPIGSIMWIHDIIHKTGST